MYRSLLIAFLAVFPMQLWAQVFPAEGSTLNYRLIGFSFPGIGKAHLEIAAGSYYSEDSFRKHAVLSLATENDRIIAEVPAFGCGYTWRVISDDKSAALKSFHHFRTAMIPNVDTAVTRLRILKNATSYSDAYVFVDGTRVLYDMQGRPVWFLPNIDHFRNENFEVRDMKLTPQGTITFIVGENAYEVNYDGAILWKMTDSGMATGAHYHHQLTRLSNGHYMVLGSEYVLCRMPAADDSTFRMIGGNSIPHDNHQYTRMPFGTVIEYDGKGNTVWSWKSFDEFKRSDRTYYEHEKHVPNITPHENAFYFDEKRKLLYVSFRNISTIMKIGYPGGKLLDAYNEGHNEDALFCHQHSCKLSERGCLYLYNNNVCNKGASPTILLMQEPGNGSGRLKKIWEYTCAIENTDSTGKKIQYQFPSGGNVTELPDSSFFVSIVAAGYSELRVVNYRKHILWSAAPERKNPLSKQWQPASLYEANIVFDHRQLESVIWDRYSGTAAR